MDALLEHHAELPAFHEITPDASDVTHDDKWKAFFFFGYGFRAEENCRRCPETARLLSEVPGLTTAFFSILSPGKELAPHTGLWNGVIRYHLGLKVPEAADKIGIQVGNETRHWHDGKSMVFDDTYVHAVWNRTDELRVVLFADVIRPCAFPGSAVNRAVIWAVAHSPFLHDATSRSTAWSRKFDARHPIAPAAS